MTTNMKSLRVLHCSDLHFEKRWFDWIRQQCHLYQAVVVSGDLIGRVENVSMHEQVTWVTEWIANFPGKRLIVCSGNHDERPDDVPPALQNWIQDLNYPHVTTDRQSVQIGDWNFECVPWNQMPLRGGPRQVAVCHCPPEGAKTAIAEPECVDFGDFELGEWLRQTQDQGAAAPFPPAAIVLSGHTHRARRWWDRIGEYSYSFNPGVGASAPFEIPNHIILDLTARIAEYRTSGSPRDRIRLAIGSAAPKSPEAP